MSQGVLGFKYEEEKGDTGMPQQSFPFQTLQMDLQHYKLFGLVTNMDWDGERLIHWHRERCGKSEEAHSVMKGGFCRGEAAVGGFWRECRLVVDYGENRYFPKSFFSIILQPVLNFCGRVPPP